MKTMLLATILAATLPVSNNSAANELWTLGVKTVSGVDKSTKEEITIPIAVFLSSTGNLKIENEETSATMQAVCTIKRDKAIRITWQNMPMINSLDTTIHIDGRVFRNSYVWSKEGDVIYRMAGDSIDLTQAMQDGKTVSIKFEHIGKRYNASFDLTGFTDAYNAFNEKCGF